MTNLYHNSTTANHLKTLKATKAAEMRQHINAMKAVTLRFEAILNDLEDLRRVELDIGGFLHTGGLDDRQAAVLLNKLAIKQRRVYKRVDSFLTEVDNTFIK